MSYSAPSGLTIGTIQISREFDHVGDPRVGAVLRRTVVEQVERHLDRQVLARVLVAVNRTSGSPSSVATLSDTLSAQIVRPWYDVPDDPLHERRVGGDAGQLGDRLVVVVVRRVGGREVDRARPRAVAAPGRRPREPQPLDAVAEPPDPPHLAPGHARDHVRVVRLHRRARAGDHRPVEGVARPVDLVQPGPVCGGRRRGQDQHGERPCQDGTTAAAEPHSHSLGRLAARAYSHPGHPGGTPRASSATMSAAGWTAVTAPADRPA